MRRTLEIMMICGTLMVTTLAVAGDGTAPGDGGASQAFARLKGLAGTWDVKTPEGDGVITYRVGSAGSVVIEDLFGGTPHEMMTVYHMDGDDLVATHYCAAGNQPRFRLEGDGDPAAGYHFAFAGGSNMKPTDGHIHEGTIRLIDGDHVESEWVFWKDGRPQDAMTFTMTRRSGE